MKLLFAIVDREDANTVVRNLSHRGFSSPNWPPPVDFSSPTILRFW